MVTAKHAGSSRGSSLGVALAAVGLLGLASGCTGGIDGTIQPGSGSTSVTSGDAATPGGSAPGGPAPSAATSAPGSTPGAASDVALLDCPATPLPAYGVAGSVSLSQPFRDSCAVCHGAAGQGQGKYPAVPGMLSEAEFVQQARTGSGAMPSFRADYISDENLHKDYAALKALAGVPDRAAVVAADPAKWSPAEVEARYQLGLKAFRKPGAVDGLACANCHSPDGIELAVIGFTDDEILRRGQQHLSPADALLVRDFVHAQRRRFDIVRTCSPDWRPFQPGGKVLPGNTAAEQDVAFLGELSQRGLKVAAGKVIGLADAHAAMTEMQALDLRTLPIGVPLPRWAEDKFDGPEHRDINDYMPIVPHIPNDPAAYYAKDDAYLANPTDVALFDLVKRQAADTNDGGYAAVSSVPKSPSSNCPTYDTSTTWLIRNVNEPKRGAVLVAAHLFREELRKPGSFLARGRSPFPGSDTALNPMFRVGSENVEPPCYDHIDHPQYIKSFPEGFRAEFPESDLAAGIVSNATDRLTHPWMMLGQVMDQTLLSTLPDSGNKTHYWAFRNFVQREVNLPFLYVHRLANQLAYASQMRGTDAFPRALGPYASVDQLNPLLHNNNQNHAGLSGAVSPADFGPAAAGINQLKGNLIRMILLLSEELLKSGEAISSDQNADHDQGVVPSTRNLEGYLTGLEKLASDAKASQDLKAQGFDFDLYATQTRALWQNVLSLMQQAPRK